MPVKLTTSGRGKLTTYFAGEDFTFMHVSWLIIFCFISSRFALIDK
jgi:hypothetical protein